MSIQSAVQKLCLGTAQFGLDYGISNNSGKVRSANVSEILRLAHKSGISTLDTASQYGDADTIISEICRSNHIHFNIFAKSPKIDCLAVRFDEVRALILDHIDRTFDTLNTHLIEVFYIRNPEILIELYGNEALSFLHELKSIRPIQKIGTSVYNRQQIDHTLKHFQPDVIQIPFGVLDQRLKHDHTLSMLSERGIEIHARSIFTQGLIFLASDALPPFLKSAEPHLIDFHRKIKNHDLCPLHAAFHFVLQQPEISRIIFGVTSVQELEEALTAMEAPKPKDIDWTSFGLYDDRILNPQNWGR